MDVLEIVGANPTMTEEKKRAREWQEEKTIIIMFGLEPDISLLDCRTKSGNDNKKRKHENDSIIFLMLDF